MVGQYNASITQRLNGLKEHTANTTDHNVNLINIDPLADTPNDKADNSPKKDS